jgi:hypothetical protein
MRHTRVVVESGSPEVRILDRTDSRAGARMKNNAVVEPRGRLDPCSGSAICGEDLAYGNWWCWEVWVAGAESSKPQ